MIALTEHLLSLLDRHPSRDCGRADHRASRIRRSLLSAYNVSLLVAFAVLVIAVGVGVRSSMVTDAGGVLLVASVAMGVTAARQRSHALGAGGDLREHELSRRWIWQPRADAAAGERVYIGRQDEIVHIRPWRDHIPYVSMTRAGDEGPRLPLGEGQHIFLVGATGSGKTTTARRLIAARVLGQKIVAAGDRSEGRSGRRRADAPARGGRRRPVRPV